MELEQAAETMFRDMNKKRLNLLEYFFESFIVLMLLVSLLVSFALAFYPDFSILNDGFCEVGVVRAVIEKSDLISFILLQTAIWILFISLLLFFSLLVLFFKERKITKYLSWVGTFFGVAQCPLNIIIFVYHGAYEFHMIFVIMGPLFLNLAVMFYTAVFFIDKRLPKISKYSFLILSIIAIAFSILVGIAASIGGTFNAQAQRLGNTLFNYLSVLTYTLQGTIFFLLVRKAKKLQTENHSKSLSV